MAIDFTALVTSVQAAIQDTASRLAVSAINDCIAEAIGGRYTQARARNLVADFAGDGHTYQWALSPAAVQGYQHEFSVITKIEYPADQRPPSYLDTEEFGTRLIATPAPGAQAAGSIAVTGSPATGDTLTVSVSTDNGATSTAATYTAVSGDTLFEVIAGIVNEINLALGATIQASGTASPIAILAAAAGAAGSSIRIKAAVSMGAGIAATPVAFTVLAGGADAVYPYLTLGSTTPTSGSTMRVYYTAPHSVDGSTVPSLDVNAIKNLAAALCCKRLAASYAQSGFSAIGADATDYAQKSSRYTALAKDFDQEFQRLMGMDKSTEPPASSQTISWQEPLESGWEKLTH